MTDVDPLFGPGGFFEITEELVGSQTYPVFAHRNRSIAELFDQTAAHGDNQFLVFADGRRYTYAEFRAASIATAHQLRDQHGVSPSDRVGICAANCPEWIFAFFGISLLGAIPVAYNGWWTVDEIRHASEVTEPSLLIIDQKRLDRLAGASLLMPTLTIESDFGALVEAGSANPAQTERPTVEIDEDDTALILFTSGTTGPPKGAIVPHRTVMGFIQTLWAIGAKAAMATGAAPVPSVPLVVMPLFHLSGLYSQLLMTMATGQKTVWTVGRFDPVQAMELTRQEGVNQWAGAVTHLYRIFDHPDFADFDASGIVRVSVGGSATTTEMIRTQDEHLPHLKGRASSGYGSTESGSVISLAGYAMLTEDPSCVGAVLPTVAVKITDDNGDEVSDGIDGNICVRSAYTINGYWNDPEATDELFLTDGWLLTGDFGHMRNGLLHLSSRTRDLVIRGGENIHPGEIEDRLEQHPDVAEVALIGVDDRDLGQKTKAVVVAHPGASPTADELQAFVGETLASYKVPDLIELRQDPLPRNATGKVIKTAVAAGVDPEQVGDEGE